MNCPNCGGPLRVGDVRCRKCGSMVPTKQAAPNTPVPVPPAPLAPVAGPPTEQKSKLAAGLLGVLLGGLGIHRFYLGYNTIGVIQLLLTVVTGGIAWIWGFIEGILILTGSLNKDADGNPLKGPLKYCPVGEPVANER